MTTQIVAHRGASAHHPENTLASFAAALELDVEGVELDVSLTADGVPVILHDPTLDRTSNGSGNVSELTFDELGAFDVGAGERIPSVRSVVELAAGRKQITFDIKDARALPALLDIITEHPRLSWSATSGLREALEELIRLCPTARIHVGSLGSASLDDLRAMAREASYPEEEVDVAAQRVHSRQLGLRESIEFATRIGATGLGVWDRGISESDVADIHDAGLTASVWTVNDAARAAELFSWGVDSIATDDPESILDARARWVATK